MSKDVRATAARVVAAVLGGLSLNRVLPEKLNDVSERDRALLQQLSYGTLRHGPRLQAVLKQLLDKPLRDKDRDVHGLLLCGLYQLDSTRVPDHAAVAATVDATRALKKPWAKGLANAVLRRYLREREQLTQALDPAAAASHPAWLFQKILEQWPDYAAAIIDANNEQPPMTLRVNLSQVSRDDYLEELKDHGIMATAGSLSEHAIRLGLPIDVWELPGFSAGRVSVQDEAAQIAALLLRAKAGERVLDTCAAPGGKACHIVELQPQLGELVVMDIDKARLQKVSENLTRLSLNATQVIGDAAHPSASLEPGSFDRVLVDAPCSATGVIRRHPDVKLLRHENDIASLADQQLDILQGAWPLLKRGGALLYVTCSILDEENSQVIQRFLTKQGDAVLSNVEMAGSALVSHGHQLLPSTTGTDGLFYALLKKPK